MPPTFQGALNAYQNDFNSMIGRGDYRADKGMQYNQRPTALTEIGRAHV